jgi:hypothetical protein
MKSSLLKKSVYEIIAIISTLGIISWLVSDFFGGMFLFLFSFAWIIIPIIILYFISIVNTIISISRSGLNNNKLKAALHVALIFGIIVIKVIQSDLLKSKRLVTAILRDDLYTYTLVLRENGDCENTVNGIFFYEDVFYGKYTMKQDTIIFLKKPYNNDFLPDTVLLDSEAKAIFIAKDETGNFSRKEGFLSYFEIL